MKLRMSTEGTLTVRKIRHSEDSWSLLVGDALEIVGTPEELFTLVELMDEAVTRA